ncbi:MAG: hypothetical protein LBE91_04170, partial [Tannerella sp.]|nr:hypothetical protein [Tannerella sp.]
MKTVKIIIILCLTLLSTALQAQTGNNSEKVTEINLNSLYSIRIRQIPESEYTDQKQKSEHLRHKPYKVISDFAKARKMLGKRLKMIETIENEVRYDKEITFKDKTKLRLTWEYSFIAYYPELNILLLEVDAGSPGDYPLDLNGSADSAIAGNPQYHAVSPDRQLRINGYYPGGPVDGS